MNEQNCRILNWNVRGLNTKARRPVVRDLVTEHNCSIVCLQETKMQNLDATIVPEALDPKFANNFTNLPAQDTRGGVLLAVNEDYCNLLETQIRGHTVTAKLEAKTYPISWRLIGVYGPQSDQDKMHFLAEIKGCKQPDLDRWLIQGDFNMILSAEDKNNSNINRRLMGAFQEHG